MSNTEQKRNWHTWDKLHCRVCGYNPGYIKYIEESELQKWEIEDESNYHGFVFGHCPKCKESIQWARKE